MNSYEISKKVLEKAAFGYKTDDVDSFIIEIIAYVKKLEEENKDYDEKMSVLAEKIEDYRDQEESMKEVLLSAQRVSTQVISDARKKAEAMINESTIKSEQMAREAEKTLERATLDAELNAKSILDDAKRKADEMLVGAQKQAEEEEEHLAFIQKKVSDFKAELLSTYRAHLDLITKLPSEEDEKPEEEPSVNMSSTHIDDADIHSDFSVSASFTESETTFAPKENDYGFDVQEPEKTTNFDKEVEEQFKKDEAAKTRAVIQIKDTKSSKNQDVKKSDFAKKSPLKITVKENKNTDSSTKYESKFGELDFGKNSKK